MGAKMTLCRFESLEVRQEFLNVLRFLSRPFDFAISLSSNDAAAGARAARLAARDMTPARSGSAAPHGLAADRSPKRRGHFQLTSLRLAMACG